MLYKVHKFIEKFGLSNSYARIIVAISGGPDSVALLHILNRLGFECIAAHCNFHLRMEESNRDEKFVRKLCETMKIKYQCIDFDTSKYAQENKISIEMAARELRYDWFEKLREQFNAEAIATGHHACDNAETMLLNLIRGTGIKGLTGIPARNGYIIRPLLMCNRKEILQYINANKLSYVDDSSNFESDFNRNKIRNKIIPLMEEINPSVQNTLSKSIARFSNFTLFYEQSMNEKIKDIVDNSGSNFMIDIGKLNSNTTPALILYEILYPFGFHPDVIENIYENIQSEPGKLYYSHNYRLLKDREFLIISANANNNNSIYFISQTDEFISFPLIIKIDKFEKDKLITFSANKNNLYVDAEKVTFPLKIRRWQNGDIFHPFGMKGRKKVSDFLIDNKLSIVDKEKIWLLVSGDEIIWIIGMRADERFKISNQTRKVLHFSIST